MFSRLFTKLCGVQTGSVAFLSSYIIECLCRLLVKKETKNEMSGFKEKKNLFWQLGGVDSDGDILMWSERRSWRKDGCMKTLRAHIR